jgi:hypothetical protein
MRLCRKLDTNAINSSPIFFGLNPPDLHYSQLKKELLLSKTSYHDLLSIYKIRSQT